MAASSDHLVTCLSARSTIRSGIKRRTDHIDGPAVARDGSRGFKMLSVTLVRGFLAVSRRSPTRPEEPRNCAALSFDTTPERAGSLPISLF
jgi:hypothetical protein